MGSGRHNKLANSIHKKFILDCIEKDLNAVEIRELLKKRGMDISLPTLRNFINKVKMQGVNAAQFNEQIGATALEVSEKLNQIPELSSIFKRRNFLLDTLLERRKKMLDFADEGNRVVILISYIDKLKDRLEKEELIEAKQDIQEIKSFIFKNFKSYAPNVRVESLIKEYTMAIHDICKYVEQWTSEHEVRELLEKICKELTKISIETFGPMIKKETPEFRDKCINNFIQNVEKMMEEIQETQLISGEKK